MLITELAKAVHQNAVEHGWWEDEREAPEIVALIHSEWSEALEEARAGRPMVWYMCSACEYEEPCVVDANAAMACGFDRAGKKPEGIAVELIDGCIRILDYAGKLKTEFSETDGTTSKVEGLYSDNNVSKVPDKLPELIAYLHMYTSAALSMTFVIPDMLALMQTMALALSWVKKQGLDPLAILLEKHEYNKNRPYKHGKKF